MNLISFLGDVLHLASIFILLVKMFATRSSKGISRKTQVLYAVVFVTRYLDLGHMLYKVFVLFKLPSLVMTYLSLMKVLYIGSSIFIVYLMYVKPPFSKTYNRELDKVRMEMLMIPCFLLAMIWNEKFTIEEVLYTFSLWVEAVAIVPQLFMVHQVARTSGGFVENLTGHYVFTLGGYRALYLLNWIYRLLTEPGYWHPIVWITGIIQTAIYCDFFYYYITTVGRGQSLVLPV
ncbi:ER lumen protein-retaining receptor [Plasmodiophora brassicae]|uniref:ER lumen protein-retaining receptor n=1 Tax=Plasmodiophora brassicae TaxID=37360 RepID=A0A3P3XYS1_PLABS|nr:unnamed protein product [Plasmodiophora brassicae]